MIFVNVKVKKEEEGVKVYNIKYSRWYKLKGLVYGHDDKDTLFNQIQILFDGCGLITTEENLNNYKELFYEFADADIIVDTRESGNLLLNLSFGAPKKLPIEKVTIAEYIIDDFGKVIMGDSASNIIDDINDLDVNDLRSKYKDVFETKDSYVQMAKAYIYDFDKILKYIPNAQLIKDVKERIDYSYNDNLSYKNVDTYKWSIELFLKELDDAKMLLNQLIEESSNGLKLHQYEFAYLDESVFNKEDLIEYIPF